MDNQATPKPEEVAEYGQFRLTVETVQEGLAAGRQRWRVFRPDGSLLFADLTPLDAEALKHLVHGYYQGKRDGEQAGADAARREIRRALGIS